MLHRVRVISISRLRVRKKKKRETSDIDSAFFAELVTPFLLI